VLVRKRTGGGGTDADGAGAGRKDASAVRPYILQRARSVPIHATKYDPMREKHVSHTAVSTYAIPRKDTSGDKLVCRCVPTTKETSVSSRERIETVKRQPIYIAPVHAHNTCTRFFSIAQLADPISRASPSILRIMSDSPVKFEIQLYAQLLKGQLRSRHHLPTPHHVRRSEMTTEAMHRRLIQGALALKNDI
jgi:hypothetical protein